MNCCWSQSPLELARELLMHVLTSSAFPGLSTLTHTALVCIPQAGWECSGKDSPFSGEVIRLPPSMTGFCSLRPSLVHPAASHIILLFVFSVSLTTGSFSLAYK